MLTGLRMTILLTLLTGAIYPGVVTALCQALFPARANGSLITRDGKIVGSALIGQNFTKPEYFHSRLSAAGADGYDGTSSGGSNLGPTSRKLMDRMKGTVESVRAANPAFQGDLPADVATASASGLDPHISPESAALQAARVAAARGISAANVTSLIERHVEDRDLGFIGEPRVNVLAINLALDEKFPLNLRSGGGK